MAAAVQTWPKGGLAGSAALHLLALGAVLLWQAGRSSPPPASDTPPAITVSLSFAPPQAAQPEPEATPPQPAPAVQAEAPAAVSKPVVKPHKPATAPQHPILAAVQDAPAAPAPTEAVQAPALAAPPAVTAPAPAIMPGAYLSSIERTVKDHLIYPPQALRRHEQGVVRVSMLLAADGSVMEMKEEAGEASPQLVAAALQAVRDAAPFPPLPTGLNDMRLVVPVVFSLKG